MRFLILCLSLCALARADVSLDIQQGTLKPFMLGMVQFSGAAQKKGDLRTVVMSDLNSCGFIKIANPAAYTDVAPWGSTPDFAAWQLIQCQGVVQATVTQTSNELSIRFQFWDVYDKTRRLDFTLTTRPEDWRRLAHIMADKIYQAITGDPGYFDTRIVYIAQSEGKNRIRRLALMDQDGAQHQFLTNETESVITPRFSPREQKVVYMSYGQGQTEAKVYLMDIDHRTTKCLSTLKGITYAPRFTPDGQFVLLSRAYRGYSHIYKISVSTGETQALTQGPSINTSPSMSPDGRSIVFNSDRGGRKQLYVMDADGKNVRRISYQDGGYATPVWSPDGAKIAFTKIEKGRFYIGTMNPDGTDEQLIADGFLVEGPSWSPDGQMLLFYREDEEDIKPTLYKVHRTGRFMARISTPMGGIDPSWSPPLPFRTQ